MAKVLRERTTVSLEWVVARALSMGGAANAGHYVRTRPWKSVRRNVPKAMLRFIKRGANRPGTIMHTDPDCRPPLTPTATPDCEPPNICDAKELERQQQGAREAGRIGYIVGGL